MEYVEGSTLSAWRKQFDGQKVPFDKAVEICAKAAAALDFAHENNIIHRDVKPSNIMVTPDEKIKVMDFGLAAEVRSSMSRVSQDKFDTSGTRPYMAPEQWIGKKQSAATDQYALAVMFYELISGEVPFQSVFETGDAMLMMNVVEQKQPETLTELDKKQNGVLFQALNKNSEERFVTCNDFIKAMSNGKVKFSRVSVKKSDSHIKKIFAAIMLIALVTSCSWYVWEKYDDNLKAKIKTAHLVKQKQEQQNQAKLKLVRLAKLKHEQELKAKLEVARIAKQKKEQEEYRQSRASKGPDLLIQVPRDKDTIQEAMDYAQAGDTILLAPGEYKEAITFKSGVKLSGSDKKLCRIIPVPGAATAITALNCKSGTIENITIDGMNKKDNNLFSLGISWERKGSDYFIKKISNDSLASRADIPFGAKFVSINNINHHYSLPYILAKGGKSSRVKLILLINKKLKTFNLKTQQLNKSGNWPDGIILLDSSININNCIVTNCLGAGIIVSGNGKSNITNNISNKNGSGITFDNGSSGTVINNTCRKNKGDGIIFSSGASGSINKNICEENKNGILFASGEEGTLSKNICNENKNSGILLLFKGTQVELDKNTCWKNSIGITLQLGAKGTVRNSVCNENKLYGIFIASEANGRINDNICSENEFGILINHKNTHAEINRNTCWGNIVGISFQNAAKGSANSNICNENKNSGIYIDGKGTQVELNKNICQKNSTGISFYKQAKGIASNNTCNGNKFWGIIINDKGTQAELNKNICRKNTVGISFQAAAKGSANGNICNGNKNSGIFINGKGTHAELNKNTCWKNSTGILFDKQAKGVASNNTCNKNKLHGISFGTGASGTISNNTCNSNKDCAIAVRGKGTQAEIKKNNCNKNKFGIYLDNGANGRVSDNTCNYNKDSGIVLFGKDTSPSLINNICNNNNRYGIYRHKDCKTYINKNSNKAQNNNQNFCFN